VTRVRFDAGFLNDERWERLGLEAFHLHIAACAFTVATLSDGVLSFARVRTLTPLVTEPNTVAEQLISDGLWTRLDGGLLKVCDALEDLRTAAGRGDEQPAKAYVDREREKARARKEAWKAKHSGENAVPTGVRNSPHSNAAQPSAVQDPKGSSPASALAPAAPPNDTDGNAVPDCVPEDKPLGSTDAVWRATWHRAGTALPTSQRTYKRVLTEARLLLSEDQREAASG
jgi:hypothetical protein